MEITTMSQAMQLHARILKNPTDSSTAGDLSRLFTFSALSGDVDYAALVLDSLRHEPHNSYFHNTLVRAHSQSSQPHLALSLFLSMHRRRAPPPDHFTFPFVLRACVRSFRSRFGRQVHALVYKSGLHTNRIIQNSLIHFYSAYRDSEHAQKVFDAMPERDVVSWTSMIDGFVDDGRPVEAIGLFERMLDSGVQPNDATVISVLRACVDAGALEAGRKVHRLVEREQELGLNTKAHIRTALVDMYAKCGCIDTAADVFDKTANKDVFIWTAMIAGFGSHGRCTDAVALFDRMEEEYGLKPDQKTMTAILSACRNVGWVDRGLAYFNSMREKYQVKPTIQHYGCVVGLLGRSGQLDEAEEFIRGMPLKPDAVAWRTLLWACKFHGDNDRAQRLMKHMKLRRIDTGFSDSSTYVLFANVLASARKWEEKGRVRRLMSQKGLRKPPGTSRIELNGSVHEFSAGDSSHSEAGKIYEKLDEIEEGLRGERYEPKLEDVMLEIGEEEKAHQLAHHSERLAVAFGLIGSGPGAQIRIVKNLRSCEDCHAVMKLVSKMYQREIIVRDRVRFHHFKDGECSCRDYW